MPASAPFVASVEDGSPAAEAGIQASDIIVAVDGREIAGSADLRNRIGLSPAGSRVEIDYLRDGARRMATLTVSGESGPSRASARVMPDRLAGADFQDASGNVLVANVTPGSPAAQAGLRTGDVIVAVNRRPVGTVAELTRLLGETRGTIALDLFRGGARLLLVIR